MAEILTNIEASFLRYLYQNLEVLHGIKVLEDVYSSDFENYSEWVVIESLSNGFTNQPKQLFFVHCAQQKGMRDAKAKLTALFNRVVNLLEEGEQIDLYDYDTGLVIGHMEVVNPSASPVLQHRGGGSMRSITVGLTYQAT